MTYYRLNKNRDTFVTQIEAFPEYRITNTSSQYLSFRDYYNDSHSYYYITTDEPLRRTTSSLNIYNDVDIASSRGRTVNQLQNYFGGYWADYESLAQYTGSMSVADIPKAFFGKEIVRSKFRVTEISSSGQKRYVWDDGYGSLYSNCYFNSSSLNVTRFDGIDDRVVSTAPVVTSSFTIACWLKLTGINGIGYSHIALAGGGYNTGFDTVVFGVFAESGSFGNADVLGWPPHEEQWVPDWPSQIYMSPYWPTWEKGWGPQWFTEPPEMVEPILYFGGGNSTVTPLSTKEVSIGTWYRTVMIYNSSSNEVTYYVDGANHGTRTVGSMSIDAGNMFIGVYNDTPSILHPFPGCLYDMRIYSRSWTAGEITDDYSGTIVSTESLVKHWWLDEIFAGPTVHEEIGSTYDTVIGATTSSVIGYPPPTCLHNCLTANCDSKIGNIFYSEGIAFLTNSLFTGSWPITSSDITYEISFTGSNNIYVQNVFCHIKDHEANFSNNESAYTLAENNEKIKIYTGSEDKTWITGIGLYDKEYKLVGATKFASPIRKLPNDKLLFKLRIDL